MITRTLTATTVKVTLIEKSEMRIFEETATIYYEFDEKKFMKEYSQKLGEYEMIVKAEPIDTYTVKYGMSEEDFVAFGHVL